MENSDTLASTQKSFVVTAVFMTQRTVSARSETAALQMCEEELVPEGATKRNLVNWHAHSVE